MKFLRNFEKQALFEAKEYDEMLKPLDKLVTAYQDAESKATDGRPVSMIGYNYGNNVKKVKDYAKGKRRDKQVWFLRIARAFIAHELLSQTNRIPEIHIMAEKLAADYARQCGGLSGNLRMFINMMEHYDGIEYGKVKHYRYDANKDEATVFAELKIFEDEYIQRAKGKMSMQPGDEIILKLPPYYWVLLNRASCPLEAAAMGHCGNSPAQHTKQRIISLRKLVDEIDGVDYYEPCLTFILLEDGQLGEMKGKGNLKPAEHYHDQVEALLHHPLIKGLRGGGYMPQNNFAMSDLGDERAAANIAKKTSLLPMKEEYALHGLTDSLAEKIYNGFVHYGRAFYQTATGMGPDDLSPEDRSKLFDAYPLMMGAKDYYEKHGLNKDLMEMLKANLGWDKIGLRGTGSRDAWMKENNFKIEDMSEQDQNRLFNRYPELMTALQYYTRLGLTDYFSDLIADKVGDYGQQWYDKPGFTAGFMPAIMKEEDRRKLWTKHPEIMTVMDEYSLHGMTEEFADEINNGVAEEGYYFYETKGIDFAEFSEEDRAKLFKMHPDLAPFKHQLEVLGGDSPEFVKNAEWACENAWAEWNGEASFHPTWDEKKKHFLFESWTNVYDLIDSYGDQSMKHYGKEDYRADHYGQADADQLEDAMPLQAIAKLRQVAQDYWKGENADQYEDDEELQDAAETEVDSWSEIVEQISEHDSDLHDEMENAVRSGEEAGEETEVYEAVSKALDGIELSAGTLDFTMGKSSKGEPYIDMHEPCQWIMTPAQIAKFIDSDLKDVSSANLKGVLKGEGIELNTARYGFSGFDEDSAWQHFWENTDMFDDLEPNPYKGQIEKMSEKKLRAAIEHVLSLMPERKARYAGYKPDEAYSVEKLREKLEELTGKYYVK